MSEDLRVSLKLWAGAIIFAAIFWALLRSNLINGLADTTPPNWLWLVVGAAAVGELGRFGWSLWRRRVRKVGRPD